MTGPEFTTIAEAARLLGVSERTARRHAGRLPDSDRQTPDSGPVRVRVAALSKSLGMSPIGDTAPDSDGHSAGQVSDSAGQGDSTKTAPKQPQENRRQTGDKEATGVEWEIITRQDKQIETLTRALDQAQQLHLAALAELREVRQKSERLEAENRRLLEAAPVRQNETESLAREVPDTAGQMPVTVTTGDALAGETGPGGVLTPPDASEGDSGAKPGENRGAFSEGNGVNHGRNQNRRWWEFWKGNG